MIQQQLRAIPRWSWHHQRFSDWGGCLMSDPWRLPLPISRISSRSRFDHLRFLFFQQGIANMETKEVFCSFREFPFREKSEPDPEPRWMYLSDLWGSSPSGLPGLIQRVDRGIPGARRGMQFDRDFLRGLFGHQWEPNDDTAKWKTFLCTRLSTAHADSQTFEDSDNFGIAILSGLSTAMLPRKIIDGLIIMLQCTDQNPVLIKNAVAPPGFEGWYVRWCARSGKMHAPSHFSQCFYPKVLFLSDSRG